MNGFKFDPQGRVFIATHDVRGAIVTANASLSTSDGVFTTLNPGDVDYFTDIVEATFSNSSTGGVGVDLYNDGTIVRHFDLPASSSSQFQWGAPLKQVTKNTPWQLDISGADITATTVNVGAQLIKKLN